MYDNLTQTTTYQQALTNLEQTKQELDIKLKSSIRKVYTIALGILVLSIGFLFIIDAFAFAYIFPGVMIPMITGIIHIGMKFSYKQKFINKHINDEIIKLFNDEHDITFTYEYKLKVPKEFNVNMGIFPKYSSIFTTYRLEGHTTNNRPLTILRCRMVTSNGKSSTIHFDGLYAILDIQTTDSFQIRTSGKPRTKNPMFKKLEEYEEKVFIPEESSSIDPTYLHLFQDISTTFTTRDHYIASNQKQVHIAIWEKIKNPLPETLDYYSLQSYAEPLVRYLEFINTTVTQLEENVI